MSKIMKKPTVFISQLLPEAELAELINRYNIGLELISFSISENLDHIEQTLKQVKAMLSEMGNPSITMHGPFLDLNPMAFDSKIRQVTMERFSQCYMAAHELGAEKIVYHSGMIPSVYLTEGWSDRIADFWNQFLQDHGEIPVCMENVLDREIAPILDAAQKVEHKNFGLCLDVGHANCYARESVLDWVQSLAPYIRHMHLHDNHGMKDEHRALGDGNIPWAEVLSAVSTEKNNLTYTIECANFADVEKSLVELPIVLPEI